MNKLAFVIVILSLAACKKEDATLPKKSWDDVRTIKVIGARLGSIPYQFSDTLALTFVGTGFEVRSVSPWNGAGTPFIFDPFPIEKDDLFLLKLESVDCPRYPGEVCFDDEIFAYPVDYSKNLSFDWPIVMDSLSNVILRVEYGF